MKRIIFITSIILLSLISQQHSFGADFQVNGISYNITNKETNEVEVASGSRSYSGSTTIPAAVQYNSVQYVVTAIGDSAFKSCNNLESVTIPFSVTTIGSEAFYGCSRLKSVTIPNSVTTISDYAFRYCTGLKEVQISDLASWCKINFGNYVANPLNYAEHLYLNGDEIKNLIIPEGITSINKYAFASCRGLTSVTIHNSVTTIGDNAFEGCTGLKEVQISDLPSWCKINFGNDSANPLCYAHHLYLNGDEIKNLIIPEGITSINNYAFRYCTGLTSVTIPNSVTTIGSGAFVGCSGLKEVQISDLPSWCKINFGNYAANPLCYAHHLYLNGDEIKNLIIPEGITSINKYAFASCRGLTSVTIHNSVTTIGDNAFEGCTGLTSVTIPNSVTTIGSSAFSYCIGLKSVTIPNSVTTIGDLAFNLCTGLTSVTIPNSVTTIGDDAFSYCEELINLNIGNKITSIGQSAFANCNKLNTVNIYATEAPTMSSDSFPYNTATFHIPKGCKPNYTYLYTFGNIIDDLENDMDSVDDVFVDNSDGKVDIYLLNGQVVKLNADKTDVENLTPGLYIINGKKVYIL